MATVIPVIRARREQEDEQGDEQGDEQNARNGDDVDRRGINILKQIENIVDTAKPPGPETPVTGTRKSPPQSRAAEFAGSDVNGNAKKAWDKETGTQVSPPPPLMKPKE